MKYSLVGLIFLLAVWPVNSHEWYPHRCCSGADCAPLDESRIKELEGGAILVDNKWTMTKIEDSQDGRYHACFPGADQTKHPLCVFRPPRGF